MGTSMNRNLVMLAMMISTFLAAIEGTIVSTAMPTIVGELHGIKYMNWIFSIYLLFSAVTVPVFGKMADVIGRKKIFYFGTLVFMLGSALCGISHSMNALIIYRAIQGVGAGALLPVTATIVADIYPYEKRAKMTGFINIVWGIAGVFGPLAGGFFVDQITWRWIFCINLPFGIITLIMVFFFFHERIEKSERHIDYLGALMFSVGTFLLMFALQIGGEHNEWLTSKMGILIVGAILFIVFFILVERKAKEPLMPMSLFRIRTISVANGIGLFISAVIMGINVYIPMWLQGIMGYGALDSGLVLAPMQVMWAIGSFICGRMLIKSGIKVTNVIAVGLCLITAIILLMVNIGTTRFLFYFLSAIQGLSFGIIMTSTTVIIQSSVGWSMRGIATASFTFFRNIGQTIGIAILGTYFNAQIQKSLMAEGLSGKSHLDQMNQLINPKLAAQIPGDIRSELRHILVSGLHGVFILLFVITLMGWLIAFAFPNKEMVTSRIEMIKSKGDKGGNVA